MAETSSTMSLSTLANELATQRAEMMKLAILQGKHQMEVSKIAALGQGLVDAARKGKLN